MGILDDYKQSNFTPQAFSQQAASPMSSAGRQSPHLIFEPHMQEAAKQFNIPYERLYGIINQESSFNPNATNRTIDPKTGKPSSAGGGGQFIDSTWKGFGAGGDRFNPRDATFATARYLRSNLDRFNGDIDKATIAHFTGPDGIGNPKGIDYLRMVQGKSPGGSPHIQEGFEPPPSYAKPSFSTSQSQSSLAGMNPDQMKVFNEGLPADTRSIQTIRGNKEGWYSPQQSREFATLGESLRGQPGEATYDSNQKMTSLREHNTTLENVQRLQSQGRIAAEVSGIEAAAKLMGQGSRPSAESVVNKVENPQANIPSINNTKAIEDALQFQKDQKAQQDEDARERTENERMTAWPTLRKRRSFYDMEYGNPNSGT